MQLVQLIDSRLSKFKNEIKKMSGDEIKIENRNKIVIFLKKILEFNYLNKKGQGLKIFTPQQMLSRLPISLAQLKAWNNSDRLENEIRDLLYSLYHSKKLSKTNYKHLNGII